MILPLAATLAEAHKPAPAVDPWNDAGLAATVAKVVPLIERESGRGFRTPPVVALATPDVFGKVVAEEQALILGAVQRDTPKELREQQIAEGGLVPGILGKYAVFEDELFLCRDALEQAVASLGHPVDDAPAFATVVLVHELVHALHDQQLDLAEQVRALPDTDAMYAWQSTTEGLATWVTERVAADLGLQAQAKELEHLQGWSDAGLEEKRAFPVWSAYGAGRDAMRWHFEHGGVDEVWAVALRPPVSSAGVFRPERWADPRPPPSRDWRAVLLGTEKKLTDAAWILGISPVGEHDLRGEALFGTDEAALADVLAHLREAWQLDGALPDRSGQVRVMVFDGPEAATRYVDLLRSQQQAEAADLSRPGAEVDLTFAPFEDAAGDQAVLRESRLRGAGGVFTERHAAWVRRGAVLVAVTASGFRPGLRLGWTVDEVFRRLDAPAPAPP